jgi:protein-tyrosine phosphatase
MNVGNSVTLERNQTSERTRKIRVLFVCTGNICRSPMAEAVFTHLVREAGLENHIEADSVGTGNWHIDSAAHPGTLGILAENGIGYCGVGRQISPDDLQNFDFVITMDDEHLSHVLRMEKKLGKGHAQVVPLLEFTPDIGVREAPDPYFIGGFDVVFFLVNEGCKALLQKIRNEYSI